MEIPVDGENISSKIQKYTNFNFHLTSQFSSHGIKEIPNFSTFDRNKKNQIGKATACKRPNIQKDVYEEPNQGLHADLPKKVQNHTFSSPSALIRIADCVFVLLVAVFLVLGD